MSGPIGAGVTTLAAIVARLVYEEDVTRRAEGGTVRASGAELSAGRGGGAGEGAAVGFRV